MNNSTKNYLNTCYFIITTRPQLLAYWLSCGYTSHLTQNRSFQRRFPQSVSWLGMEKTKPNTTKARIHQWKEMYYNTKKLKLVLVTFDNIRPGNRARKDVGKQSIRYKQANNISTEIKNRSKGALCPEPTWGNHNYWLLALPSPQSCSPRTLLQQLHWLRIKHRIDFKIANITFRTLHFSQLAYRRSFLHACHSTRSLRLSNTNLLSAPFVCTSFGVRSFNVAAPIIWNSLPLSLRTCTILIPPVVTSRPNTASRPSYPLNPFPLAPQIRLLLTIVRV